MPIRNPADLTDGLARDARILGLDLGTRTIGLALSDVGRSIATPYETIRRTKLKIDLTRLHQIVTTEGVDALVLGLPINMDDSQGPRCQATRQFAADLLREFDIPLAFWDERLSSDVAKSALLDADVPRKRRRETIDRVAAAVILQGFLDSLAANRNK